LQEKATAEGRLEHFRNALDAHTAYYNINIDPKTKKFFPHHVQGL
jgi:hypothetical protein